MVLRSPALLCPRPSSCYGFVSRLDAGGERMVPGGLILLCPNLLSS